MSTRGVPLIDISSFYTGDEADKRRLAKDVGDACERIGFLVITGHKVPPEAIEALTTQSRAFFDLPVELKCNSAPDVQQVFRGYSPLSKESLAALSSDGEAAPPDIKESFDIGPFRADPAKVAPEYADNYYDNIWPEEPSGFRSAAERYFDELEALADDLLAILAGALDLPDDYFSSFTRDHLGLSDLRLINYPEMPDEVAPGQIRGGAHTDYTTITPTRRARTFPRSAATPVRTLSTSAATGCQMRRRSPSMSRASTRCRSIAAPSRCAPKWNTRRGCISTRTIWTYKASLRTRRVISFLPIVVIRGGGSVCSCATSPTKRRYFHQA